MASVGPPSSKSDCTPSAASAESSSVERPRPQLELGPSGSGPRPNASRRGCLGASTPRASRRGSSARTVPIPTATASERARSSCTRRRLSSPVTQRELGNGHPAVERDRSLVGDEGPAGAAQRAKALVLDARAPLVAPSRRARPRSQRRATARARARRCAGRDRPRRPPRAPLLRLRARPRREAYARDARTARASRRRGRAAGPLRGGLERDDLGVRPARALVPSLAHHLAVADTTDPTTGFGRVVHRPRSARSSARARKSASATGGDRAQAAIRGARVRLGEDRAAGHEGGRARLAHRARRFPPRCLRRPARRPARRVPRAGRGCARAPRA